MFHFKVLIKSYIFKLEKKRRKNWELYGQQALLNSMGTINGGQ